MMPVGSQLVQRMQIGNFSTKSYSTSRLPNLVVIGAPKSGTTSLFYYLQQHPDIFVPVRKELHYFTYQHLSENTGGPGDRETLSSLCATRDEYGAHYLSVKAQKIVGEFSPSYLYYSDVSVRIQAELGNVKIIVMLRNPIEKAYSQYMHLVRDQRETLGFYDALMAEPGRMRDGWADIWRYAEGALHAQRLRKYLDVFGQDNVHVILFDSLTENPQETVKQVFSFLNVDPDVPCDTRRVYNRTGKARSRLISRFLNGPSAVKTALKTIVPERIRITLRLALMDLNTGSKYLMDHRAREYLSEYYRNDVHDLESLLGRSLGWLGDSK